MKNMMAAALIGALMLTGSMSAFAAEEDNGIWNEITGESGITYANLFEVILDEAYDQIWLDSAAAVVGEDAAEQRHQKQYLEQRKIVFRKQVMMAYS